MTKSNKKDFSNWIQNIREDTWTTELEKLFKAQHGKDVVFYLGNPRPTKAYKSWELTNMGYKGLYIKNFSGVA